MESVKDQTAWSRKGGGRARGPHRGTRRRSGRANLGTGHRHLAACRNDKHRGRDRAGRARRNRHERGQHRRPGRPSVRGRCDRRHAADQGAPRFATLVHRAESIAILAHWVEGAPRRFRPQRRVMLVKAAHSRNAQTRLATGPGRRPKRRVAGNGWELLAGRPTRSMTRVTTRQGRGWRRCRPLRRGDGTSPGRCLGAGGIGSRHDDDKASPPHHGDLAQAVAVMVEFARGRRPTSATSGVM